MTAEGLGGFVVGIVVAAPIVFLLTNWAAAKVWRCVPCKNGEPVIRNGEPVKDLNSFEYSGF